MNPSKRSLGIIWLALFMGCYASAQQRPVERNGRFFRATGNAEIAVKPDQVQIQIGVVTEAKTAKSAAAANADQTGKMLEQLKKAVGANGEIRTTSYMTPCIRSTVTTSKEGSARSSGSRPPIWCTSS